jgi:hypothetical protein
MPQGTGLTFCQEAPTLVEVGQITTANPNPASAPTPTNSSQQSLVVAGPPCRLPPWLQQSSKAPLLSGPNGLACPQLLLVNSTAATADPAASQWGGCTCDRAEDVLTAVSGGRQLVPRPQPDGASSTAGSGVDDVAQVEVGSLRWSCVDPDEAALAKALKERSFALGLMWVLGGLLMWPLLWFPTKYIW